MTKSTENPMMRTTHKDSVTPSYQPFMTMMDTTLEMMIMTHMIESRL